MSAKTKTWKQDIADNEQAFITVIRIAAEIGSFLEYSDRGKKFREEYPGMGGGDSALAECGFIVTMLSKWLAVAKKVNPNELLDSIVNEFDRVNRPTEA